MSRLSSFAGKNFIDQITLLNQVAIDGSDQEIRELIDLSSKSSGDGTIDVMITHTLRDLLQKNEAATVHLLDSPRKELLQLALGIISRQKYFSAADHLASIYAAQHDSLFKNELLQTMMDLKPAAFADIFKTEVHNQDSLLSATAIKGLALSGDHSQDEYLRQLIRDNNEPDRYQNCAITTAQSIESLAMLAGADNLTFLAQAIHHKNPTARRFIQEHLSALGDVVIPYLAPLFDMEDNDIKILAANLIALTNGRMGGDLLLSALDQGKATDHNVRFAIYESLGAFPSMKTFVCLIEALSDSDPLILISVCSALNRYDFPFVAAKISERIDPATPQGQAIISALVDSESEALIRKLFDNPALQAPLAQTLVKACGNRKSQTLTDLCNALLSESSPCAPDPTHSSNGARILAVDDSMAIRRYYESVLSSAGYQVFTAEDGLNAYTKLQFDQFDLLITDLNMPNMDGIELSQKVVSEEMNPKMPIIMVTTESEQSQRTLAAKQGINAYVTKPIKVDVLLKTITELGL